MRPGSDWTRSHNTIVMKILPLSCLAVLLIGSAHAAVYSLSGTMDPQQAGTNGGFGGGTGSGNGTISGTYDDQTNRLNYTVTWADLTSPETVAHFHVGLPGVSGGVALGMSASSPSTGTNILLSESQESQLLGDQWYVNIHTQNFTGGEIRGQVLTTLVPEPGSLTLGLGAGLLALLRRRRS